jgi:hypothetical protein
MKITPKQKPRVEGSHGFQPASLAKVTLGPSKEKKHAASITPAEEP